MKIGTKNPALKSKEKRRQIIVENFNQPTHEVSLSKLQEISQVL